MLIYLNNINTLILKITLLSPLTGILFEQFWIYGLYPKILCAKFGWKLDQWLHMEGDTFLLLEKSGIVPYLKKNQNKLCQVEFSGKEDCFLNSSIYFSCFIIILLYIYSVYLPPGEKYDPPLNKHLLKDTMLILQGPIILDKMCKMNKRHI